ncbi:MULTISPECIES: hypothetical protein [unclassified Pseudoalteromonas]|uniref:hypothetical protein n=1 Tax=unclassified Pseudoalteromonas TaxID=194690 RepID=UPI00209782A0|nr:hypothetical protein [Pseudoalteromonas sp. XMcav2-N]MCO7187229.1 hypothetical protein [Pseudoalteromonas sp. XMcav2-N]
MYSSKESNFNISDSAAYWDIEAINDGYRSNYPTESDETVFIEVLKSIFGFTNILYESREVKRLGSSKKNDVTELTLEVVNNYLPAYKFIRVQYSERNKIQGILVTDGLDFLPEYLCEFTLGEKLL